MNIRILTALLILIVLAVPACVAGEDKAPFQTAESRRTALEALSLVDACKLVALINEEKWEQIENVLGRKDGAIAGLRPGATHENWPGIGAYRGTRTDEEDPARITHRFGFAPRSSPHELWISYTISESGISKPALQILGW